MIKRKTIIILDGTNKSDYDRICKILDYEIPKHQGWEILREPLLNRVTASKTDEVKQ